MVGQAPSSLRAFCINLPCTPPVADGLTFALDPAVDAWITDQGLAPVKVYSAPILTSQTSTYQNWPFFTEIELVQWQAQMQAALSARTAWNAAIGTMSTQLGTVLTAQHASDAAPADSGLLATLATELATLATDGTALASAERTYADAIALMRSPVLGVPNPFYNADDWDLLPLT